jgi:hypothetical protein
VIIIHDVEDVWKAICVMCVAVNSTTQIISRCTCKYIDRVLLRVHFVVRNDSDPVQVPCNTSKVDSVPDVVESQMHVNTSIDLLPVNARCNHTFLMSLDLQMEIMMMMMMTFRNILLDVPIAAETLGI